MFTTRTNVRQRLPILWRVLTTTSLLLALVVSMATVESADAATSWTVGQQMVVATNALNSRTGAGLASPVNRVLTSGTRLALTGGPVSANGYTWYKYDSWGLTGWVAGEFLAPWSASALFPQGSVLQVAVARLNLRSAAGYGGTVQAAMWKGDRVVALNQTVAADGYTWIRVNAGKYGLGWVAGELVSPTGQKAIVTGVWIVVVDGPLNMRSSAGLSGSVLAKLAYGTKLVVTEGPVSKDGYTWFKVHNAGIGTGWIASAFVGIDPQGGVIED